MIDLPCNELHAQQAEICRRVNQDRWLDKFLPIPSTHRQGVPMIDSIETSEREAREFVPAPVPSSTGALPGNPESDARFAVAHPDVLHTPQQFRTILVGLLNLIERERAARAGATT